MCAKTLRCKARRLLIGNGAVGETMHALEARLGEVDDSPESIGY